MKRTAVLFGSVAFLFFCHPVRAAGQANPMIMDSLVKRDTMNFAVLVLDFLTYKFEKASIEYFPLCKDCDRDSLPLKVFYRQPGDFGEIRFLYSETSDTLFGATIIWDGTGSIFHPAKFRQAGEFPAGQMKIEKPADARYYDYTLTPDIYSIKDYAARADSAWEAINSLDIVNQFASVPFRAAFYAYPPSVGVFCPSCAKWIVFLYAGNLFGQQVTTAAEPDDWTVYPVPARNELFIDFKSIKPGNRSIRIFDTQGSLVMVDESANSQNLRLDISRLDAGLYFVKIDGRNRDFLRKVLIIRN